jgi:hypothetical protein
MLMFRPQIEFVIATEATVADVFRFMMAPSIERALGRTPTLVAQ